MAVETALYPSQLNTNWPTAADMVSEGDDHLRLIKTVDKTTWPNVAGAVSASHIELNYLVGVTSGIQAQLNAKGAIAGQTWTGAHVYSGSIAVPTLTQGTSTTGAASTAFVQNEWSTRLPNYSAPITASSTELNYVAGVTSAIQTQLNTKGAISGQTWTGTHDFSGGSITVPTMGAADNSTNAASTAFVQSKAFATALPNQTGNAGKFVTTDGSVASWSSTINGDLNFGGTGRRITGDFTNAALSSRLAIQTSVANSATVPLVIPSGTASVAGIYCVAASDPTNAPYLASYTDGSASQIQSGAYGTGAVKPLVFGVPSEAMRIDTSGNVFVTGSGVLGYGVGSGGTVTQLTNKSTAVTLNKPSGQIVMQATDSIPASGYVIFNLVNSLITATDTVVVSLKSGSGFLPFYSFTTAPFNGGCEISVRNSNVNPMAEALVLNFAVLKASTS